MQLGGRRRRRRRDLREELELLLLLETTGRAEHATLLGRRIDQHLDRYEPSDEERARRQRTTFLLTVAGLAVLFLPDSIMHSGWFFWLVVLVGAPVAAMVIEGTGPRESLKQLRRDLRWPGSRGDQ